MKNVARIFVALRRLANPVSPAPKKSRAATKPPVVETVEAVTPAPEPPVVETVEAVPAPEPPVVETVEAVAPQFRVKLGPKHAFRVERAKEAVPAPAPEPPVVETVEASSPSPEPTAEDTLLRLWASLSEGGVAVKRDLSEEEVGPTGYLDRTPMDEKAIVQVGSDPWGRKYVAVRVLAASAVQGSDGLSERTGVVTFFERYEGGGMWTWGSAQFVRLPFEPRLSLGDSLSIAHLIAGGAVEDGDGDTPRLQLRLAEPQVEAQPETETEPEPQPETETEPEPQPKPSFEERHLHRVALRDIRRSIPRGQGRAGRAVALSGLVDDSVGGKEVDRARALRGLLAACDRLDEGAMYKLLPYLSRIVSSMIRDGQGLTATLAVRCYAEETAPKRVVLPLRDVPLEATLFSVAKRGALRKAQSPIYGEDTFREWYNEGQEVPGVVFGNTADGSLLFLSDSGHLFVTSGNTLLLGEKAEESPTQLWEGVRELIV